MANIYFKACSQTKHGDPEWFLGKSINIEDFNNISAPVQDTLKAVTRSGMSWIKPCGPLRSPTRQCLPCLNCGSQWFPVLFMWKQPWQKNLVSLAQVLVPHDVTLHQKRKFDHGPQPRPHGKLHGN